MTPGKYNIVCPQGSTFVKSITYYIDGEPVDLSSHSAKMQIRESHKSEEVTLELSTENFRIFLGEEGTISLELSSEVTAGIYPKEYVYDLEISMPGMGTPIVTRLIEGKFIVTPEVTR